MLYSVGIAQRDHRVEPMLSFSFTDDEMMSRRSIDRLHDFYRNAPVERRCIRSADVKAKRIGHFGFFRPQFRSTLRSKVRTRLEERTMPNNQAQSLSGKTA